jgi:hypothetical protein
MPGGVGGSVWFENAVLTPEPATLTILGLGGLLLRRRKYVFPCCTFVFMQQKGNHNL